MIREIEMFPLSDFWVWGVNLECAAYDKSSSMLSESAPGVLRRNDERAWRPRWATRMASV
jgi:hypothetical protein